MKTVHIHYYAVMREKAGVSEETLKTSAATLQDLYVECQARHHFPLSKDLLRVARNDAFVAWTTALATDDVIVFIPPVSGG